MKKSELLRALSVKAELSKEAVERVVNEFTALITESVKEGGEVSITGFGVFKRVTKKARIGRNPTTGQQIDIPEKNIITFKPGKALRSAVSGE